MLEFSALIELPAPGRAVCNTIVVSGKVIFLLSPSQLLVSFFEHCAKLFYSSIS